MEELILFSKQLSELIDENERLKEHIRNTEEWFKLAICVNNSLDYRSTENTDKLCYQHFIDNTLIVYASSGIHLVWKNDVPVNFDGRIVLGKSPVKLCEINEIFNGKKLIISSTIMADKDKAPDKPRVIPSVPPADREKLNEGYERPNNLR